MTRTLADDLGTVVRLPDRVRRVVSLVPSLTETVGVTGPGLLVGVTAYCTHPGGLDAAVVGGTKNPDVDAVVALRPDLVLANEEENRPVDLARLRAAGVPVWVTEVRDVPGGLRSLARVLDACGLGRPRWLDDAERAWRPEGGGRSPSSSFAGAGRRRAFVPIWRRPWMVLGRDTFAGDVLARLGVDNVYSGYAATGGAGDRYPRIELAELRRARVDLVVLPDEPYPFSAEDGPEAFPGMPCALVSGRHLTWYGPSLAEAREVLGGQLAAARRWA